MTNRTWFSQTFPSIPILRKSIAVQQIFDLANQSTTASRYKVLAETATRQDNFVFPFALPTGWL